MADEKWFRVLCAYIIGRPVSRTASAASSPEFAMPHAVCAARSTYEVSVQTGSAVLARMFASSARCCFLDCLAAHWASILIVALWVLVNTALRRFYRRAPDAPCRISLAISFLASLVFIGHQHRCSRYVMLLNRTKTEQILVSSPSTNFSAVVDSLLKFPSKGSHT